MEFKDSFQNLEYISNNIDLNDPSSYDQILHILGGTIMSLNFVTLKKGAYLYRARPKKNDEKFSSKKDLGYRIDLENILDFGRANSPNQSLFYAAHTDKAAVFETSSLIRENRADINIEYLTVGRWFVKNPIRLLAIITNQEAILKNRELRHLAEIMRFDPINSNPETKRILDYFSNEFAKNVKGDTNMYKISAAFYNTIQRNANGQCFGIMYPSVGFEHNDINVALLPETVDNNLILDMIGEYKIDFNTEPRSIIQIGLGDIKSFDMRYFL